jgi:PAS domain S-box-containing protein
MPGHRSPEVIAAELRRLAAEAQSGRDRDRASLIHELQVFQEELTVQNDALREMHAELEVSRDRFVQLYDFAPNGYVTLNAHGVILEINLTGAAWLGRSKQALAGTPFLGFVTEPCRDRWMQYLRRCRDLDNGAVVSVEIDIRSPDGSRAIELFCKPEPGSDRREYLTAMIDINEQKRLRAETEREAQARAALAGRLISIQEHERRRIARDLHDNVGQQITTLRLQLDAIMRHASEPLSQAAANQALNVVAQLDHALDFLASELRPVALDLGLVMALREFVSDWSSTFGVAAAVHANKIDGLTLSAEAETHVYRLVQEALNNVHKHASATHVQLMLTRRRTTLELRINDDGVGFSADGPPRSRHAFGLIGMRERAALIGGMIDIESAPGRGTTILLVVPQAFGGVLPRP